MSHWRSVCLGHPVLPRFEEPQDCRRTPGRGSRTLRDCEATDNLRDPDPSHEVTDI